jgi:hypothetical protein
MGKILARKDFWRIYEDRSALDRAFGCTGGIIIHFGDRETHYTYAVPVSMYSASKLVTA